MWTAQLRPVAIAVAVVGFTSSALADTVPSCSLDHARQKGAPAEKPLTAEMRQALERINKLHGGMNQKDIDDAVGALHREIARHDPRAFVPLAVPHLIRLAPRDTQTRVLLRKALARGWLEEQATRAYLVQAGDTPGPHIRPLVKALDDKDP